MYPKKFVTLEQTNYGTMTRRQWPNFMKEVYRILKPGVGWVQYDDFNPLYRCDDNSVPVTAAIWKVP
jgi:hypothetical protein